PPIAALFPYPTLFRSDDSTVPFRWRGDWYYSRYEEGREYPIHARRSGSLEAPEEVLLDLNRLAEGHGFYQVGTFELSPDRQLLRSEEHTSELQSREKL